MNTENDDQQAEQGSTEVAQTLHGDQARAEKYDQPAGDEVVKLPGEGETLVAKRPAGTDDES